MRERRTFARGMDRSFEVEDDPREGNVCSNSTRPSPSFCTGSFYQDQFLLYRV